MFRGNPGRTGEYPGPGPRAPVAPLWGTRLGSAVSSTPALADGVLFVGSVSEYSLAGGALHAVDARTGEEIWRLHTVAGDAFFSSPAVVDGVVYAASHAGIVIAADAKRGEELWRFQAEGAVYSSPLVWNEAVAFGDETGRCYCLAASNGQERWRFGLDSPYRRASNASPSVADDTIFFVNSAQYAGENSILYALRAGTGEPHWQFISPTGGRVQSATCVSSGRVHAATAEGLLHALDVDDGTEVWRYDTGATVQTLPALAGESLYLITRQLPHRLHVVESETGKVRSVFEVGGEAEIVSSPTVARGRVYFGDEDGRVYSVDGQSGQEQWRIRAGSLISTMVVANGAVYFGSEQGQLRAIGGSLKPDLSPP